MRPHRLLIQSNANRAPRSEPLANYWLNHPERREYEGVTFLPDREQVGYFNLWRGFAVKPEPGDCSLFLLHIRDVICRGDEVLCEWVVDWIAQIIQQPGVKTGTSLVLRGVQGAGKTKFGEVIGSLLDVHYSQVAEPRYIVGRFNSHLAICLLLHADEGFWAGDKVAEGKLKDLITGTHQLVEYKGKEPIRIPNYLRLLVTSNSDWVVPANMGERRFAVLDVSPHRANDHKYFAAIDRQLENGGREALFHFLLHKDLTSVNLRKIPTTPALLEQKVHGMNSEDSWWYSRLRAGAIGSELLGWRAEVPRQGVYEDYVNFCTETGIRRRISDSQLGMFLRKAVPTLADKRPAAKGKTSRVRCYVFPSLGTCRRMFAERWGGGLHWSDDVELDL